MAQKTALAVYALPGPTHSFVAKAAGVLMFRTLAADTYIDGAITGQTLLSGAVTGDTLIDGAVAAETEPN